MPVWGFLFILCSMFYSGVSFVVVFDHMLHLSSGMPECMTVILAWEELAVAVVIVTNVFYCACRKGDR